MRASDLNGRSRKSEGAFITGARKGVFFSKEENTVRKAISLLRYFTTIFIAKQVYS